MNGESNPPLFALGISKSPLEFTAKLGVPQELIDEGERALNRFKWTLIALVGGYIALNVYVAYLQVSGAS